VFQQNRVEMLLHDFDQPIGRLDFGCIIHYSIVQEGTVWSTGVPVPAMPPKCCDTHPLVWYSRLIIPRNEASIAGQAGVQDTMTHHTGWKAGHLCIASLGGRIQRDPTHPARQGNHVLLRSLSLRRRRQWHASVLPLREGSSSIHAGGISSPPVHA
jgi:hypothetical protein